LRTWAAMSSNHPRRGRRHDRTRVKSFTQPRSICTKDRRINTEALLFHGKIA
jgi:hypothetical protein